MDETQPLLQEPALPTPVLKDDANIVDFDPDGDVDNPLDWPVAYKRFIVGLLALTAFTVYVFCNVTHGYALADTSNQDIHMHIACAHCKPDIARSRWGPCQ